MSQEHDETNHGLINTPMQTLVAAGLGFTVPVFVIMGLVTFYSSGTKTGVGAIPTPQALEQRIEKVGESEVGDPAKLQPQPRPHQRQPPLQRLPPRRPLMRARKSTTPPAWPATAPVWPMLPSWATKRLGRHALPQGLTKC